MMKEVDRPGCFGLGWQTGLIGQVTGWGLVRVWFQVGKGGRPGYWVLLG